MEETIYEEGTAIGILSAQEDGLFWKFNVQIENRPEQIRRVFVLSGWESQYLGIPDASGMLTARLARRHLPQGVSGAVATVWPRCPWRPWRGEIGGVPVAAAWLRSAPGSLELALPPESAARFPAWAAWFQSEPLFDTTMAVIALDQQSNSPLREKEGGTTNETNDEVCCALSGASAEPVLSADPAADSDAGGTGAAEADCADPG